MEKSIYSPQFSSPATTDPLLDSSVLTGAKVVLGQNKRLASSVKSVLVVTSHRADFPNFVLESRATKMCNLWKFVNMQMTQINMVIKL